MAYDNNHDGVGPRPNVPQPTEDDDGRQKTPDSGADNQ